MTALGDRLRAMLVKASRLERERDTDARNTEVAAAAGEILRGMLQGAKSDGLELAHVVAVQVAQLEACYRSTVATVAELRDQLEQLRQASSEFRYAGTWKRGAAYKAGNFCTDDGSLWACLHDTTDRPGASTHWQLAVKRGRDGRDAP